MNCPLCNNSKTEAYCTIREIHYLICNNCELVFLSPSHYLSHEKEKERYATHNNDVEDINYQNFVSPIVNSVLKDFSANSHGLDFGAGSGPVITEMLRRKSFTLSLYDPFFHPDKSVLNSTYDFIVCCEVMEHFQQPAKEFRLLQKQLNKGGKLYCMTVLLPKHGEFKDWYYKNDPTHVVFYSEKNLNWIKDNMGFEDVKVDGRLIVFTN